MIVTRPIQWLHMRQLNALIKILRLPGQQLSLHRLPAAPEVPASAWEGAAGSGSLAVAEAG